MDNSSSGKIQTTIWHLSMLLAPLLLLISQFFWTNGVLTIQLVSHSIIAQRILRAQKG
jgi:hypothetical protein